eukprot:4648212-Amphidinium_carterae.1
MLDNRKPTLPLHSRPNPRPHCREAFPRLPRATTALLGCCVVALQRLPFHIERLLEISRHDRRCASANAHASMLSPRT